MAVTDQRFLKNITQKVNFWIRYLLSTRFLYNSTDAIGKKSIPAWKFLYSMHRLELYSRIIKHKKNHAQKKKKSSVLLSLPFLTRDKNKELYFIAVPMEVLKIFPNYPSTLFIYDIKCEFDSWCKLLLLLFPFFFSFCECNFVPFLQIFFPQLPLRPFD